MEILNQLYHGDLSPVARPVTDAGYFKLLSKIEKQTADFVDSLIERQRQDYENIMDTNGQINSILCEIAFEQGYQLGAKLMLAVFQNAEPEEAE